MRLRVAKEKFRLNLLSFLFLGSLITNAQQLRLSGFAVDAATGKPVPFPIISVGGDSTEYLGDMEGNFSIPSTAGSSHEVLVRLRAYQYLFADVKMRAGDSVKVQMYFAHPFNWQHLSLGKEKEMLSLLLKTRRKINPGKERNYHYRSYNKSVISSANVLGLKIYLDNILRFFTKARMGQYTIDHHIFLMESAAERSFRNIANQMETITATQVSGINRPPPVSFISGFDALNIYQPFLRIGPKKYTSPLAGNPRRRYVFSIIDTVNDTEGPVLVVKFNPRSYRKKSLLQGLLYISQEPLGVKAFQVWPAFDRESTFSLSQESTLLPSGRWFPQTIKTSYRQELGSLGIPLTATSKTWISGFQSSEMEKGPFDEINFDFRHKNLQTDSLFPEKLRPYPLDEKEKSTYLFYRKAGSLDGIDRFLNLGQKLYHGRFPAGKVDLVFRDAVRVNDYEGLRLGMGLETNNRLSEKFRIGGFFAYGLGDQNRKYGFEFAWKPSDFQAFSFSGRQDLAEPGIFPFAFDRRQYPAGELRNIRVSRFDEIRSLSLKWQMRIARNFNGQLSFETGERNFLYQYQFLPLPDVRSIGISEASMQFCWNPLERFARIEQELYPVSSPLPVFWLQYVHGFTGLVSNSFEFNRLESKLQWNRKILGLGEFGIRVSGGIQSKNLPYSMNFSSRGSFREFSLISYNSFETMRYNEFFHDRFVYVFFSHRFGKMQISTLPFLPYFTMVHNMGWGSLARQELHAGIKVADIRKGYFESGLFLNDLFVIPLSGLDLGIGAGIFMRYGHYRLPSDFDNLVLKFSASLGI